MRLILVRHGQTDDNALDILSGQKGPGLNSLGKEQAQKAGYFLRKEKITAAYSSDQLRARQTAKLILKHHPGVKLHLVSEFRDRDFGTFNGKTEVKAIEEAKVHGSSWEDYSFGSGETFFQVQKRVLRRYTSIKKKHLSGTVLFVFHGDPIASLIVHLLKKSISVQATYSPKNTAISIFNLTFKGCKVELMNSLQHLG